MRQSVLILRPVASLPVNEAAKVWNSMIFEYFIRNVVYMRLARWMGWISKMKSEQFRQPHRVYLFSEQPDNPLCVYSYLAFPQLSR